MIATAFGSLFAKDCRNSKEARVCMRAKCSNGFASASSEFTTYLRKRSLRPKLVSE